MLGWWLRTSGAVRGRGRRASRIEGTDENVESKTVCAFGNQVEIRASAAKFGKRSASIRPSGPSRSSAGNSSKTKITTGGRETASVGGVSSLLQPAIATAAKSSVAKARTGQM